MCNFTIHLSPRLYPSTAGCSPPSVPSIVLCLLLSSFKWFPPFLLCRLAIFCLVIPLISSLSLVATVRRLVHLLSFILAICLAHLHVCFSVCFKCVEEFRNLSGQYYGKSMKIHVMYMIFQSLLLTERFYGVHDVSTLL